MLELVEGAVESAVDSEEFICEALKLELVLALSFDEAVQLALKFLQVDLAAFYVLLSFHKEDILLLVVSDTCLAHCVFAVFEHLDHQLQLLVKFGEGVVHGLLELVFDLKDMVFEHLCLIHRSFYLLA